MAATKRLYIVSEIEKNLYLSSWYVAVDREILEDEEIDVVVSIHDVKKPPYILEMYKEMDILSYEIEVDESGDTEMQRWFPRIYVIIDSYLKQGARVLVHCNDGYNRSVVAIASYLMLKSYLKYKSPDEIKSPTADNVLCYIARKRKHSNPLHSLVSCLRAFEIQVRNKDFDLESLRRRITS
jgi:hypothetical protein